MTEQIKHEVSLQHSLKKNRLAANLSQDELAEKLNLSVTVIIDIEEHLEKVIDEQHYSSIYLRGYLANYAKEVGLVDIGTFEQYKRLSHADKPKIKPSRSTRKPIIKVISLVITMALLLIISGIFYYWDSLSELLLVQDEIPTPTPIETSIKDQPEVMNKVITHRLEKGPLNTGMHQHNQSPTFGVGASEALDNMIEKVNIAELDQLNNDTEHEQIMSSVLDAALEEGGLQELQQLNNEAQLIETLIVDSDLLSDSAENDAVDEAIIHADDSSIEDNAEHINLVV